MRNKIMLLTVFLSGIIALGISNLSAEDKDENVTIEKTFNSKTLSIDFKDNVAIVELVLSPDENIHLKYLETSNKKYDIYEKKGVLKIRSSWEWPFGKKEASHKFVISIPTSFAGDLEFNLGNGTFNAASITSTGAIEVELDKGVATIKDSAFDNIEVDVDSGAVSIVNTKITTDLDVEVSNGRVDIANTSAGRKFEVDSTIGAITLDRISAGTKLYLTNGKGAIAGSVVGTASSFGVEGTVDRNGEWSAGGKILKTRAGAGNISLKFVD